jgi:L-fucose mutarotase
MLKGIDARLTPDALYALALMGHGDTVVLVDSNFPTETIARQSVLGRVVPLDTFVNDFAMRMQVVGAPADIPPPQAEAQAVINRAEGRARPMIGIDRFAFYDLAAKSFALVQTGERRFYGCIILRKGVIGPEV